MASKLYTLVEKGGAYKGRKIPMQKLINQRGEGAYFRGNTVLKLHHKKCYIQVSKSCSECIYICESNS